MNQADIAAVNSVLRGEYNKHSPPAVELAKTRTDRPFNILVATILSARTKDETTSQACDRLFRAVRKPHDFDALTAKQVEELIFPVGFYRVKARQLKQLPSALDRMFHGRIPGRIEDLVKLPGVGRKTANLVVAVAFNKPAICVDVHVHRISNRLGLLRTSTPLDTEMGLRRILPVKYWKTWNSYLVSFGQTICKPVRPRCDICPIYDYCDRVGVRPSGFLAMMGGLPLGRKAGGGERVTL